MSYKILDSYGSLKQYASTRDYYFFIKNDSITSVGFNVLRIETF